MSKPVEGIYYSDLLYFHTDKQEYNHSEIIRINASWNIEYNPSYELAFVQIQIFKYLDSWTIYLSEIFSQINKAGSEVDKISPLLIYDIKINADRSFFKVLYDNAALKYYRAIEMINQYVLKKYYNIDTQTPVYENLPKTVIEHLKKIAKNPNSDIEEIILYFFNNTWNTIYEKLSLLEDFTETPILPLKYGLTSGLVLRHILGDKSMSKDFIFSVYQAVEDRNKSIFAHGINSISKKSCNKLREISEKMINSIEINENLKKNVFNQKSIDTLVELFKKLL